MVDPNKELYKELFNIKQELFTRMDSIKDELFNFRGKYIEEYGKTNLILTRLTESVVTHERRSDLSEKQVSILAKQLERAGEAYHKQLLALSEGLKSQVEKQNEQIEKQNEQIEKQNTHVNNSISSITNSPVFTSYYIDKGIGDRIKQWVKDWGALLGLILTLLSIAAYTIQLSTGQFEIVKKQTNDSQ